MDRRTERIHALKYSTLGILVLLGCTLGSPRLRGIARGLAMSSEEWGRQELPGITVLTGYNKDLPELADPYFTQLRDSVLISGTGSFSLKFRSLEDVRRGGPYQIAWNDYFYSDGTPMEGGRAIGSNWDLKPTLWRNAPGEVAEIWDPSLDSGDPLLVWYGGHMRPRPGEKISYWPEDNFSRDVFAFLEKGPGQWFSRTDSIFMERGTWPRPAGNYLGHRYGHQIVMIPRPRREGNDRVSPLAPTVFYEEVTDIRPDGSPAVTKIFMDEMKTPLLARGAPAELITPLNPATGRFFPSAVREDGAALLEGPLYFRFRFENEDWEAIGFSAGSYYAKYPSCFAARRVSDGLSGKPYQIDLTNDGSDLHDAGAELGRVFKMTGGPGRPAVLVDAAGNAIPGPDGMLQVLVHGYRHDLPDRADGTGYRHRIVIYASLKVEKTSSGALRFNIPVQSLREKQVGGEITHGLISLEAGKVLSSNSGSTL